MSRRLRTHIKQHLHWGAGESSAHLWISHLPHAPHQSTSINIFIHIKIIREKSSSVAKRAQQPAPGGQPRCESDVAPHFRALQTGPFRVRFWSLFPTAYDGHVRSGTASRTLTARQAGAERGRWRYRSAGDGAWTWTAPRTHSRAAQSCCTAPHHASSGRDAVVLSAFRRFDGKACALVVGGSGLGMTGGAESWGGALF